MTNIFHKKDGLTDAVKSVMEVNQFHREAEALVNEKFGVVSRMALPHEQQASWDSEFNKIISEGAKMAKKDYDGDGKIETSTDEWKGSRDKAIKKSMAMDEEEQIDEISRDLADRAAQGFADRGDKAIKKKDYDTYKRSERGRKLAVNKSLRRAKVPAVPRNVPMPGQSTKNEEFEQIDEISNKETLQKVRNRAARRMMDSGLKDATATKVEKMASDRLKKIKGAEDEERSKREYKAWKGINEADGVSDAERNRKPYTGRKITYTKKELDDMAEKKAKEMGLPMDPMSIAKRKKEDEMSGLREMNQRDPRGADTTSPSSMNIPAPSYAKNSSTMNKNNPGPREIRSGAGAIQAGQVNTSKKRDRVGTLEEAVRNKYAIGMAAAMKSTGDEPPLKKSTIKKAHEIAKKIDERVMPQPMPARSMSPRPAFSAGAGAKFTGANAPSTPAQRAAIARGGSSAKAALTANKQKVNVGGKSNYAGPRTQNVGKGNLGGNVSTVRPTGGASSMQKNMQETLDSIQEEIAMNLYVELNYVMEQYGEEAANEWIANLSEEQLAIMENM